MHYDHTARPPKPRPIPPTPEQQAHAINIRNEEARHLPAQSTTPATPKPKA